MRCWKIPGKPVARGLPTAEGHSAAVCNETSHSNSTPPQCISVSFTFYLHLRSPALAAQHGAHTAPAWRCSYRAPSPPFTGSCCDHSSQSSSTSIPIACTLFWMAQNPIPTAGNKDTHEPVRGGKLLCTTPLLPSTKALGGL